MESEFRFRDPITRASCSVCCEVGGRQYLVIQSATKSSARVSLFTDYRRVHWLPGCDAGLQFHDRVADPVPCLVVCGASSPANELTLSFFHFLFLVNPLTTTLTTLWTLLMMFLPSTTLFLVTVLLFAAAAQVQAHVAAWTRGIWECTDGKSPVRL